MFEAADFMEVDDSDALLEATLALDPAARPTAEAALRHIKKTGDADAVAARLALARAEAQGLQDDFLFARAIGQGEGAVSIGVGKAGDGLGRIAGEDGLGVGDLFGGGLAVLEREQGLLHGKSDVLAEGHLLVRGEYAIGDELGDLVHALHGFLARARDAETDVVDIAAGAVGHHGHIAFVCAEGRLDQSGEYAKEIGGHTASRQAADVV